ncbi:uncharacterized protein LDX57_001656 [Aspergillus melleus]|uniref:uncharacterized protein n=1 Tax=Aspergillus melleus TaxID=138277 RepID=UPI001E8EA0E5|nr:uncharacterized protein LDX57_001656 [Aspergillus melleus]KAH8423904.1 hypothetical protein LDX57_001656 [Aspergillus melleus]
MPPKSKSKPPPKKDLPSKSNPKPSTSAPKPNWPPLRPLIPPSDLTLEPLLRDQIYLIPNFFPASLCKTYVSFLASLPMLTTPRKPKKDEAVRVNDRFQVQDEGFAEMVWRETALRELVVERAGECEEDEDEGEDGGRRKRTPEEIWGGKPLGLNANIRIYRYSKGQFFGAHYDDFNNVTFSSSSCPAQPARTTWTLLIYLTTCTGGETVFYPEATKENRNPSPVSVAPQTGMALLHRHGDACMLHEGKEVLAGEKWVLRSDLVVER